MDLTAQLSAPWTELRMKNQLQERPGSDNTRRGSNEVDDFQELQKHSTTKNIEYRPNDERKATENQSVVCRSHLSVNIFACGHVRFDHVLGEASCGVFRHEPRQYERVVKVSCRHDRCNHSMCMSLPVDPQGMEIAAQKLEAKLKELQQTLNAKRTELDRIPRFGQDVQLDLHLGQAQTYVYKSSSNLSMCRTWIAKAGQRRLLSKQCRGYCKAYSIILKTIQAIESNLQLAEAGLVCYRAQQTCQRDMTELFPHVQQESPVDLNPVHKSGCGQEFNYDLSRGHFLDEEMDDEGYWTRITFNETACQYY